jgi:mRNA-degrading endonuclease RelE of RelBE toxin-antitoxin system
MHEFLIEFEALESRIQKQLRKRLDDTHRSSLDGFPHEALQGKQFEGLYKFRAGDWRMIYRIIGKDVVFVTLGHRSDVYR